MGGSSSSQITHEFQNIGNALNPNTNGLTNDLNKAGATIKNVAVTSISTVKSGVMTAVSTVQNVAVPAVVNEVTHVIPSAIVSGSTQAKNVIVGSLSQVPAAVSAVPVIGQLPITQLVTGNTGGFVNSLKNEFTMGVNTLGLGSVASMIPGLGFVNPTVPQQQPQLTGGPVFLQDPNGGSGGPGMGSAPGETANSGYTPHYADSNGGGYHLDILIPAGLLLGAVVFFR